MELITVKLAAITSMYYKIKACFSLCLQDSSLCPTVTKLLQCIVVQPFLPKVFNSSSHNKEGKLSLILFCRLFYKNYRKSKDFQTDFKIYLN